MKIYTLFFAVFVLLISGCSDSAIPEVELFPDDEQLELIRPNDNPEPSELVAAYHNLADEILRDQLDGVTDSVKVLKLYRAIVDLSKYDGAMALVFKIREAEAKGKPKKEINEIAYKHYGLNRLQKTNNPCIQGCINALHQELETAYEERQSDLENGIVRSVSAGVIGGIIARDFFAGLGTAAGLILVENWIADRNYHEAVGEAANKFNNCYSKCPITTK